MDGRELARAAETRDAFRALLPYRGGRLGVAACGIGCALLLSMLVRVVGADQPRNAIPQRVASAVQRQGPALPPAPAVEAGRSDWASAAR